MSSLANKAEKQKIQWFAARRALPKAQTRWLTLMSFLLPLSVWCIVSYVPFVWHPKVDIEDAGAVDWFRPGMLVDKAVFYEERENQSSIRPYLSKFSAAILSSGLPYFYKSVN